MTGLLPPPRFGDRRSTRIGLLGGSFNPAHAGHALVASTALRRLALDQVWLMVSPGNPLKPTRGMAPLADRLAFARSVGADPRIVATDIERHLGTRRTLATLKALRRRFPRARFVWLMGADNLLQLPRWHRWMDIARLVPFAVLPRPTYTYPALADRAAARLRASRIVARQATSLAARPAPAWTVLSVRQAAISATELRKAAAPGEDRSPESPPRRPQPGQATRNESRRSPK